MIRSVALVAVVAAGWMGFGGSARAEEAESRANAPPSSNAPALRGWGALGASTGSVYRVPLTGLHATGGVVLDRPGFAVPMLLELDVGRTPAGLGTGQIAFSAGLQVRVWRARLGVGPELTYFWLSRAQGSATAPIDAIGLGVYALASVDLVELGNDRALALLLRGEAVWLRGPDSVLNFDRGAYAPRGSVALGVRF